MRPYPSVSAAIIAAVVAGLVALVLPARVVRAQIAIDRETVQLHPGQPADRVAEFVVQNAGAAEMRATVQLEAWDVDARGASRWRRSGDVAGACGDRVSVSPRQLQLAPGERQVVKVSLAGNARFDAECWSAAVVRPSASAFQVDGSTAVPVYVTPTGANVDGEVTNMYASGDSLEIVFANTGAMRSEVVGEVQVSAVDDSVAKAVLHTVPIPSATVLAGATRKFRVAMPTLPKGTYKLFAVVDFGGREMTAAEARLDVR